MQEQQRKRHKPEVGIALSAKMDKTAVVILEDFAKHKLYKKIIRRRRKVKVHDPKNSINKGDKVKIVLTSPISKDKRYRLVEIVK